MSLNPVADHQYPQAWTWEPSMNYHHRYYYPTYQPDLGEAQFMEREHMFEKPLTPSDVGKLNRLVIPKQHAEKYFPLDADSGEKGLLLSFEDEAGKSWRFRYSYWTSSQSYVLTKGWSRYVKEKKLDAGDVVLFERVRAGGDRLYIGCRRRNANESSLSQAPTTATKVATAAVPWSSPYYAAMSLGNSNPYYYMNSVQQDCYLHHAGDVQREEALESATTAPPPPGNSKRLRLFGVNLDCGPEPEPQPASSASWYSGHSSGKFMPPDHASSSEM